MRESHPSRLPRRTFLALGGSGLAATALASGCNLLDQEDPGPNTTTEKGPEAPDLAAQVEAGDLPPLEERLPANPLTVEPNDRIGNYGGVWRTAFIQEANRTAWAEFTFGYEYLVRFQPNTTDLTVDGIVPNVAESFQSDEAGTEYTFTLRDGMRWSDGEPFTADDIVFWYESIFLNEDINPAKSSWLQAGGEPVTVEKADEQTVVFRFTEPNGMFLSMLAHHGDMITRSPKHYLSQFHPDYTDDLDTVISDAGLNTWVELFESKGGTMNTRFNDPDLPTLSAWTISDGINADVEQIVAGRNPYYWKVDPEGSQLPYLDQVHFTVVAEDDTLVLNAMNGEIDFHYPNINALDNKPLFAENQESGDYHFIDIQRAISVNPVIMFNLAHADPVKREIFQNKDFRIGLSHAINRQEIIDAVFQRQGEPFQTAPRPTSTFYDEEMARQYTEYDVDLANEYLDRTGYTETNSEGIRLGPDGQPIAFDVEAATSQAEEVDSLQFIKDYWLQVGIDITVKAEDLSLWRERIAGNQHDAAVWFGMGGLDALTSPAMCFPFDANSRWAVPWGQWYQSGGQSGEEPLPAAIRQMELYDEMSTTTDPDEQNDLFRQVLQIAKEEFYTIGVTLWADTFGIVKNGFSNVPGQIIAGAYPAPANTNPCQYFWE